MQVADIVDVTGLGTSCIETVIDNGWLCQGKRAPILFLCAKTIGLMTDIITLILTFQTQHNACNEWDNSVWRAGGGDCEVLEGFCNYWDRDGAWHGCVCEAMKETCINQRTGFYFLTTHFCMERVPMLIVIFFIGCKNMPSWYQPDILDDGHGYTAGGTQTNKGENRGQLKYALWRGSLFNFTDFFAKLYEYKWDQRKVSYIFASILFCIVNCGYFGVYLNAFAFLSGMNGSVNNGENYPWFQLFLIAMGFVNAMFALLQTFMVIGSITRRSLENCCGCFVCGMCSLLVFVLTVITCIMMGTFLSLGNDEVKKG